MSIKNQSNYQIRKVCENIVWSRVTNLRPANLQMTNLHIDEMVLFCNLTKIGTDENKVI